MKTPPPPALEVGQRLISRLQLPKRRTYLQFAEEELILTTGPRRGLRFRADFMPWSRLVLEEFDRGRYRRFFLSGSVQSGKTLLAFVLPILYHAFELNETVIVGVPKIDMAQGIYEERILPSLQASRYAALIPKKGPGSRGGRITSAIRFLNGAILRFMGAGGGDAQRASFTARVVVLSEIDKMDEAGASSREADPVTQIEARTRAFGDRARLYGECTMSTEHGRIYREVSEYGTDSKPLFRCQSCGRYVPLERVSFGGWQEAPDLPTARERSFFSCPACGGRWGEAERQAALQKPVIVSRGQTVSAAGEIEGAPPATNTFGFRWTALGSSLLTMADIAEAEYRADHSGNTEDLKALAQFTWAEPYREEVLDVARPRVETVLQKTTNHERGVVPPETEKLTLGIDVGSYVVWWVLMAWRGDAQGHVVDFGGIDVPLQGGVKNPLAVLAALRTFRDNAILPGWGGRRPDLTLVDSGYEQEVVYRWVVESGEGRFLACKGYGSSSRNGLWRSGVGQSSSTRQVGNDWRISIQPTGIRLVEIHADTWKAAVHDGWAAAHGAPGSITLFNGRASDPGLRIFARQIVAEQREMDTASGKELKIKWVVLSKQNHYLDCCEYARIAADIAGIRLLRVKPPSKKTTEAAVANPHQSETSRRPVYAQRLLHRNY